MDYEVLFTKKAVKDLESLDKKTKLKIIDKIKYLSKEPLKFARKLVNPAIGQYRFRIG